MKKINIGMILVLSVFLSSCDITGLLMQLSVNDGTDQSEAGSDTGTDPIANFEAIVVDADSFVLAWEDDNPDAVSEYSIYYRVHGAEDWTILTSLAPDDELQLTIDESLLARGQWDFGILSTMDDGTDTTMHTSLENTAIPEAGWYLDWI